MAPHGTNDVSAAAKEGQRLPPTAHMPGTPHTPRVRVRGTARVVVLDPDGRVLLFEYEDVAPPDPSRPALRRFWGTPGGGVEPGETFEQAAARELYEETRIRVPAVGPWLWSRDRSLTFTDGTVLFRERYYLVRLTAAGGGQEVSTDDLQPYERSIYRAHRWWSVEDMSASAETFLPEGLPGLLAPVVRGAVPAAPLTIT
jgi:8-oxo-dGTP pyrophosphatase MutT (NUDIX family)